MTPAERRAQLAQAEVALDAEEAQRRAQLTLADRLHEAACMYILTLAELSRRASSPEEFHALLMEVEPVSLTAVWKARHGVQSR